MEKIDIVYTWIDGENKNWNTKKNIFLNKDKLYSDSPTSQIGKERYIDNQELRYSLRSIALFAPWVNHIYIITDQQKPKWLNERSNITIIDHKDIIPNELLPTFSSSVIEAHIHNINTLQEKFIYFNDDMFLGKPTYPSDFFKNGKPYVFTSSIIPRKKRNINKNNLTYNVKSILAARNIVYDYTKSNIGYGLKHGVRPLLKSRLNIISRLYYSKLAQYYTEKFRLNPFSLIYVYTFHELSEKNAHPKYIKNIKEKNNIPFYHVFFHGFFYVTSKNINFLSNNYKKIRPFIFCINEIKVNLNTITLFYDGIFSKKSIYEI